jgi:hypothetical protein
VPPKPDSSIKRGDRADTGDNQARPDELGSPDDAQLTGDPTSFGANSSIRHADSDTFNFEDELRDNDGFEAMLPEDGRLGLTNIGNKPADDWAADTGPTHSTDEMPER